MKREQKIKFMEKQNMEGTKYKTKEQENNEKCTEAT